MASFTAGGVEVVSWVSAGKRKSAMPDPERWEVPGVVPHIRVPTRSDDVAILLGPFEVHTNGIEFIARICFKPGFDYDGHGLDDKLYTILRSRGGQDAWEAGGSLSIGARVGEVETPSQASPEDGVEPALNFVGGSGGHHGWRLFYWTSPVPDRQPLTIEGAWPELGLEPGKVVLTWAELKNAIDECVALG